VRLPRLELPPDALLLFEHVPEGPDRSGAFRFAVCADGRFLHANNRPLHVDPVQLDDDDPALFWSSDLATVTQFPPDAIASIREALRAFASSPPAPQRSRPGKVSEPTSERLTAVVGGVVTSAVVPGGARPPALSQVLERVESAGRST
jgi:hypothetical protein